MILRKIAAISILIILGIACAGAVMALYTDFSVKASALSVPDVLSNIPSDYPIVFGVDVKKLVSSTAYAQLLQKNPIGNNMTEFIEKSGVDPARDISYLVGAGRAKGSSGSKGIVIAAGTFNEDTIAGYIRSKSAVTDIEYRGLKIMIPVAKSGSTDSGIVFLGAREIAMGNLESLKAVLDTRANESKSILSNPAIATLIDEIGPDEMIWFAADSAGVPTNLPTTKNGMLANVPSIKNMVGKMHINDSVAGKITVTAFDEDAAAKLADVVKGLIALGQLAGGQNPELKTLLGGIVVSRESTRVNMSFSLSFDLLNKFGQTGRIPH
jgi:hypothetical protein